VTIGTEKSIPEAFLNIYAGGNEVTGQYIVIKYRIAAEHAALITENLFIECFTSTNNTDATAGDHVNTLGKELLVADGEWHLVILDATLGSGGTFTPNANGEYIAKYIRLDALNQSDGIPTGLAIDIAFVAMCEDTSAYLESLGE